MGTSSEVQLIVTGPVATWSTRLKRHGEESSGRKRHRMVGSVVKNAASCKNFWFLVRWERRIVLQSTKACATSAARACCEHAVGVFLRSAGCGGHFESGWPQNFISCRCAFKYYLLQVTTKLTSAPLNMLLKDGGGVSSRLNKTNLQGRPGHPWGPKRNLAWGPPFLLIRWIPAINSQTIIHQTHCNSTK